MGFKRGIDPYKRLKLGEYQDADKVFKFDVKTQRVILVSPPFPEQTFTVRDYYNYISNIKDDDESFPFKLNEI